MSISIEKEIEKEINALQRMFDARSDIFEPFINYIRFPAYKRLRTNEKITFDFPLTVLAGQNGCNKSSILHALYVVPGNNSTGTYWFSTKLDNIKKVNCYIYGYNNQEAGKEVEVLKTRIYAHSKSADYWEPSRPIMKYGMEKMPEDDDMRGRTKTRWKTIEKNCSYLDFRATLSAYDKCFYFSDFNRTNKIRSAQDFIRSRSKPLQKVVKNGLKSFSYYSNNRVRKNVELTQNELKIISDILGDTYTSGRVVEHSLYSAKRDNAHMGTTIQLQRSGLEYTEAFAGSGEFSVANTVHTLISMPENSLVLLDEPEVSLHPYAQKKLLLFILREIKNKHHQVVMSTHSPFLFTKLPPEAIKILNSENGVVTISEKGHYSEASNSLGFQPFVKNILVEDHFAQLMVEKLIAARFPQGTESFNVSYMSGGADTLTSKRIPNLMETEADLLIVLDGDHKYDASVPSASIPEADNHKLDEHIQKISGSSVQFFVDSGERGQAQKIELQRRYLDYYHNRVSFLPLDTPEEIAWKLSGADEKHPEISEQEADYKERISKLALKEFGENTNSEITSAYKMLLMKVGFNDERFDELTEKIEELLANN